MDRQILKDNALLFLGAMVGGLAAGWTGAILLGFAGLILDSLFQKK